MKHWLKLCAPLSLAVLGVAAPSSAYDIKYYGGVNCVGAGSSNSYNVLDWYFENTTNALGIRAVCPIVRDRVTGSDGPYGNISVYDPTSSDGILCDLYSISATGTYIDVSVAQTTNANVGNYTLSLPTVTSGTSQRDHYFISCLLPRYARIYSYRIVENDQTE